jgi:hypothetical protein
LFCIPRKIISEDEARLQFVSSFARKSRKASGTTSKPTDLGPSQYIGEVCDRNSAVHVFTTHPGITADQGCMAFSLIVKLIRAMFACQDGEPTALPNGPNTGGHTIALPHSGSEMFEKAKKQVPAEHFQVMQLATSP